MYQQQRRVTEAFGRTLMTILWLCNVDAASAFPYVQESLCSRRAVPSQGSAQLQRKQNRQNVSEFDGFGTLVIR